jgi:proteasome lid subunit RPN8/RPN11
MLILTSYQLQTLHAHAEQQYPEECCGLLLGSPLTDESEASGVQVEAICPAENVWEEQATLDNEAGILNGKAHRYRIAPDFFLRSQAYARGNGWDIIGIYHSHPDQVAIPSEWDRQWAWPEYSYVIISVLQGVVRDVQSWTLDDKSEFHPQKLQSFDVSTPQRL